MDCATKWRGKGVGENPSSGTSDDKVDGSRAGGNEGAFGVNGRGRDAPDGTGTMIAKPQTVGIWQGRRAVPFVGMEDMLIWSPLPPNGQTSYLVTEALDIGRTLAEMPGHCESGGKDPC